MVGCPVTIFPRTKNKETEAMWFLMVGGQSHFSGCDDFVLGQVQLILNQNYFAPRLEHISVLVELLFQNCPLPLSTGMPPEMCYKGDHHHSSNTHILKKPRIFTKVKIQMQKSDIWDPNPALITVS